MRDDVFEESDLDEEDRKPKKVKKRKKHRVFWFVVRLQIFLMLLVVGAVGYYYFGGYAAEVKALREEAAALVAASDEKTFLPAQTCEVYDVNGELISQKNGEKAAQYVAYEDIPAKYIVAIISIEDKKFYSHNGVDFKAVFRAAKAMLENGKVTQGGSTITMQLGKLMFMEHGKSWQYKVQQIFIATELEKKYSKSQILEFYLNNIYFANGYYGIEAACHGYFDCELNELDMSQIAFLLSIPNSPSYYDPLTNYSNTMTRRNLILDNIYADGKMTEEEYVAAKREDVVLSLPQKSNALWNNYVDTYVYHCATRALMEQDGFSFQNYFENDEEETTYNQEYDELYAACQKKLYTGGYRIYTSIDMEKQKWLQSAVDNELAYFMEQNEEGIYQMQGAATCIDNDTGYVVAIVGGRSQNFSGYTLNRAFQSHRQPGSAIKPLIVYTPSFENGYTPDTIVDDHPIENGPENASGTYAGKMTVRTAVAKSINTIAWQLYEELTPEVGLEYLKNMNFTAIDDRDYILPTALGGFTNGVSAVEMAAAFATIENDGLYREPTCIMSIVDSDENRIYESQQLSSVVYKQTAARMMTDVLTSVMTEGTGRKLALENMPCAGKTGTTNDHKDGWFVGYTRYYTTSVWVGCDMPREVKDLMGNTYPERIWNRYMETIHQDLTPLDFLPYAKLSDEFEESQQLQEQQREQRRNQTDENADEAGDAVVDGESAAEGDAAATPNPAE